MIGLFSALAVILHMLDFPVPFLAPGFYQLDFSEIPALVGAFAFGPVAAEQLGKGWEQVDAVERRPEYRHNHGTCHTGCDL
mgnify:CR=1 FL=1